MEAHRARKPHLTQQHMGAGQGCVTAQRHLDRRSEPPKPPHTLVAGLMYEGGLGEVHLPGNVRHGPFRQRVDLQTDCCGVARKRGIGESVYGVEWNPLSGHGFRGFGGAGSKGRKAGDTMMESTVSNASAIPAQACTR